MACWLPVWPICHPYPASSWACSPGNKRHYQIALLGCWEALMVSSQKSKTSVASGTQMHKNAYIFRTTHLVQWSYYLICRKTAPCEKEPWWLLVRRSGKDQESGRARVPGSSIGFMFESCFYQHKPVPDFCFQCFLDALASLKTMLDI